MTSRRELYRRRGGIRSVLIPGLGVPAIILLSLWLLVYVPAKAFNRLDALARNRVLPKVSLSGDWADIGTHLYGVALLFGTALLLILDIARRGRRLVRFAMESPMAARTLGTPYRFAEDKLLLWARIFVFFSLGTASAVILAAGALQYALPHTNENSAMHAMIQGGMLLITFLIAWRLQGWPRANRNLLTIGLNGVAASWYAPPLLPWSKIRQIHVIFDPDLNWNREADWIHVIHEGEVPDEVGALVLSRQMIPGASATEMLRALDRYRPAAVPLHDPRRIGYEE